MKHWTALLLSIILVAACADERREDLGQRSSPPASAYELNPDNVPAHLRHLIPLAETWGIGDDVERAELLERTAAEDRQALERALAPHQRAITEWLDSFGIDPMTDEAAAFMYMQLAVEEMRSP